MSEEQATDLTETGDLEQDAPEAEVEQTEAEETEQEESSTSDQDGDDAAEQQPKKKGVGKRIDELTRQRYEAQREAEYWREKALGYLEGGQKPKPQSSEAPRAPNPLNFESDEDYQQALDAYIEQRSEHVLSKREREAEEVRQRREQEELQSTWQERMEQFAEETDDFYQVTQDPNLPVTKDMADAIMTSDKGPEVLYWLGQNPQEAGRIARLNPVGAAREIGRIEARLALPQPKKTTSAPPPIKPLSGGGETASKDPDEMTTKQWLEWRSKQLQGS